jgi:putative oxidoreductase
MSVITDVERWGNSHRPAFLDIVRIVLGLYITYKGFYFIINMDQLEMTASGVNTYFAGAYLAHYIIFAHVLGGPLIAFGLFTRIVCLFQLPILLGAVFMVNYPRGYLGIGQHMELWVSLLVLAGLITMMIFGAGEYSIDAKRRREMLTAQH